MTERSNDGSLDLAAVEAWLNQFAERRDWPQFHNPKILVMALVGEVGELSETHSVACAGWRLEVLVMP